MANSVNLLEVFPAWEPEAPLRAALETARVTHVAISAEARTVELELTSAQYLPERLLGEASRAICRAYGLAKVLISPAYAPELLPTMDFSDLNHVFEQLHSPAAATLAGAKWHCPAQDKLTLQLRANGRKNLEPYLPQAQAWLQRRFGVSPEIEILGGETQSYEQLRQTAEERRQEILRSTASQTPASPGAPAAKKKAAVPLPVATDVIYGHSFKGEVTPISDLTLDMFRVIIEGEIFAVNHKELKKRGAWVISFDVTDYHGSVRINQFMEDAKAKPILEGIKPGMWVKIQGKMTFDRYDNETVMQPQAIMVGKKPQRVDTAKEKRVELHLHTTMSNMDALTVTGQAVAQAAKWGHRAIAITDHGVCHSFPDAMKAAGKAKVAGTDENIKILYGCEAYFVNDVDETVAVHGPLDVPLTGEFVAFDLETTGLSAQNDRIIEIGAVIWRDGKPAEHFQSFVDPERMISRATTDLTGITDDMIAGAPKIEQALPEFLEFCAGRPLVAHNAAFDIGFVAKNCARLGLSFTPTYVDTLALAQSLLPDLKNHKLDTVAEALALPEFNHHRADDDALTAAYLLGKFFEMLAQRGIIQLQQVNALTAQLCSGTRIKERQTRHMILFAKNQTGLRNLYRLVSDSNLKYFRRRPRIPKSELMKWREGILIGSACEAGELFRAITSGRDEEELRRIASFYDFLEIQPLANNAFMLRNGQAENEEQLREWNRTVVRLGEALGKPVVATGDVHFLNPEDEIFRHILLATHGMNDGDNETPLYFRTTDEMLREFSYLGEEKAHEVVVTNPNLIVDMCDTIRPVPHGLYAPKIDRSAEQLKELVYGKMHRLYGDNPPELVTKRVETELGDIIRCHYDVIYMSAQKLVQNSLEHGYLVGSRGSVGSSIVAYMSGITEVNAFPPHYRCPKCRYVTFDVPDECACGADLPDRVCPQCGANLDKDGFNIPFETFLGFGGDKVPDIDLNFSGEYQSRAHRYTFDLFGESHVFRAGTIGTVAEKTAFGYVKKYLDERGKTVSKAEENRLAQGCVGVKRTSGQHPGGMVVIPAENEIYDFCPVQHPADSTDTDIVTTHFEYHSMEENLLKLDMLGHDDPTMIRMLQDLTQIDPTKIPLDDKDTMSLFTSSAVLGFENDPILGPTGAVAIPEFGTSFTRGMLIDTQPTQFDTLLRLSGFSHGTDVWLGNARDLITSGTASVNDAIGCRDDIMLYLIKCGMPEKRSFKIMESVRKGRGLPDGAEEEMLAAGVPEWYIGSCKKIKYLFPKGHAVAYVMMAFRIAWFKVHAPQAFYAAYFSIRADAFDAALMCHGIETVTAKIKEISGNPDAAAVEKDQLTTLEVVYEFYRRGYTFTPMDIYTSDAVNFKVTPTGLQPPFVAVTGLGESAAQSIVECRAGKRFLAIDEFAAACPKVSKTHIENLKAAGAFGNLPDTSQVSLF